MKRKLLTQAVCLALAVSCMPAVALAQDAATAAPQQQQDTGDQDRNDDAKNLDTVVVTGSRIPRAQIEGPAPITVITAEQILAGGFTSVPDLMQSLTQNNGETQSQQSAGGADFSPGAQQVDLRGLGPNHTLVLVNGRYIAPAARATTTLQEGDALAIWPPISGG